MSIDGDTKALLNRWENIKNGDGLKTAARAALAVRAIGAIALSLTGIALFEGMYPIPAAIAAAVFGWTTAEANALKSREKMWPIFSRYINWNRVRDDLRGPATPS